MKALTEIEQIDQPAFKMIEYAYPSSKFATDAGFRDSGCWFVRLYASADAVFNGKTLPNTFGSKKEAKVFADSLSHPYSNHIRRYFDFS